MAWVPKEITENPKIAAVNELLRRHNAGDPDAASFTPDIANELRKRFTEESKPKKWSEKGGELERQLTALPLYGGVAGGIVGNVPGAALGGGAGLALKKTVGLLAGFDEPAFTGPPAGDTTLERLGSSLSRNIGQQKAFAKEMFPESARQAAYQLGANLIPTVARTGQTIADLSKRGVRKLATSVWPQATKDVQKAVIKGAPTLGEEAAARGIWGTKQNVMKRVLESKGNIGNEIDAVLAEADQAGTKIKLKPIVDEFEKITDKLRTIGDNQKVVLIERKLAEFVAKHTGSPKLNFVMARNAARTAESTLTPSEANLIKRINADAAKKIYSSPSPDHVASAQAEYSKALADGIRHQIEEVAPRMAYLNREYNIYRKLSESVSQSIAKDLQRGGISFAREIPVGGAGVAGYYAGGIPGAVGAAVATKGSQSFPVRTFAAAMLTKFAKGVPGEQVAAEMMSNPGTRKLLLDSMAKAIKYVGVAKTSQAAGKFIGEQGKTTENE